MTDKESPAAPVPEPENMVRWDPEHEPCERIPLCIYLREMIDHPPWEDSDGEPSSGGD